MAEEYTFDAEHLLSGDPDDDELLDAVESLTVATYRNVTEWKTATRSEDSVSKIEEHGEKAAQAAYLLDRVQSKWANRNQDRINYDDNTHKMSLTENERKINRAGHDAYRFAKDAGTRREFFGKENQVGDSADKMNYGDFCLISGNNVGFESVDREYESGIEPVENKLDRMNPSIIDVEINRNADITELEESEDTEIFEF